MYYYILPSVAELPEVYNLVTSKTGFYIFPNMDSAISGFYTFNSVISYV